MQETLLLTELLDDYTNGQAWLECNPTRAHWFVQQALELLRKSNAKSIYHMDVSAFNIMLNEKAVEPMNVIDMENCFVEPLVIPPKPSPFRWGFCIAVTCISSSPKPSTTHWFIAPLPGKLWM
ncbi:hypothetical protein [Pseudomonas coronafaciens]|uniref:hypothetical protein n=1 Tax=Pseudomonas coronafaciens TaxID=53409 RepID=UPI00399A2919